MRSWVCLGAVVLLGACGEVDRPDASADVLVLELGGDGEILRRALQSSGRSASSGKAAEMESRGALPIADPGAASQEGREPDPRPPEAPPRRPREPEFFTVYLREGETLYGLAAARLGSGSRWRELLPLNGWTEEQASSLPVGTAVKFPLR